MDKKTLKKVHVWVRAVIQLLYFLFIPSAYTAAFNGVKYIFTQMGAKSHLELTSFVVTLIALCLYSADFSAGLPVPSEVSGMQCAHFMCLSARNGKRNR